MFGVFILTNTAQADGMIIPPPDYYMYETGQKAVIFHENNVETLIVSIAFQGNAKDFAWIIPTPTKPEVSKSTEQLFTSLETLTQYYNYPMYESGKGVVPMAAEKDYGVTVVETKKVDYYDVTVLQSDDRDALVKWLNENKYKFPEEEKYILNDYIDNNWYFVAMKIDSSALKSDIVEQQLFSGNATPVKLVFESKNIVYPMKISGVTVNKDRFQPPMPEPIPMMETDSQVQVNSTEPSSETVSVTSEGVASPDQPVSDIAYMPYYYGANVTIYVLADHKKELSGFYTEYADWQKKKDIEKWATDIMGNPWVKMNSNKYFLTKMTRYMSTSEMTSDLFPQNAESNKAVGAGPVPFEIVIKLIIYLLLFVSLFGGIIIFSPIGIGFIACALIQFLSKSKLAYTICYVFQAILLAISIFLLLVVAAIDMLDFSNLRYLLAPEMYMQQKGIMILAGLIACLGAIAAMIITMFMQRKHHAKLAGGKKGK